jgi:hypothetical protein
MVLQVWLLESLSFKQTRTRKNKWWSGPEFLAEVASQPHVFFPQIVKIDKKTAMNSKLSIEH